MTHPRPQFTLSDHAREAAGWVLEQVAEACGTTPHLILSRPRNVESGAMSAACRGFRVAATVMLRLGFQPRQVAATLNTLGPAVHNARKRVSRQPQESSLVERILSTPEARQFAEQLAATPAAALLERVAALEQRVLALESAVRRLSDADFRRLDALILAGWGDVRQDKIPTDVLIRALLGLPVPPPPNGQAQSGVVRQAA